MDLGLATLGSAIIGGITSGFGQHSANQLSKEEAEKNRRFQKMMSDTAVYRRMQDLKRSGINPILAARFDASTPAGAMAQFGNVGGAAMTGAQQGVATTAQGSMLQPQIDLIEVQRELTENKEKITSIMADMANWFSEQDWSSMLDQARRDWNSFTAAAAQMVADGSAAIGNFAEALINLPEQGLQRVLSAIEETAMYIQQNSSIPFFRRDQ